MISNKIALVTGGSRGLGKNMALSLAEKGSDVILTYNSNEEDAIAVVKEIEGKGRRAAATLQLNVGETKSFDNFIERVSQILKEKWGRNTFDFLINNAGVEGNGPIADMSEETFDLLCNIHFKGVFFLTQKSLPLIADRGRIVNVSSGLGSLTNHGDPAWEFYEMKPLAYKSSKTALNAFTVMLAHELKASNIKVNSADPGYTATDMNAHSGYKTVAQGASVILGLATLPHDGVTGSYFDDQGALPW